jgi:hypothetical protein
MRAAGQQEIAAVVSKSGRFPVFEEVSPRRPMMSMEAAKGALDRDEDEVVALIGTWLIGWDIATPGSGRREWRVLTRSVSLGAQFLGRIQQPPQWNWNDVLGLVFLPLIMPRLCVTGVEVQHSLNCSSTHVMRLIECEALKLLPGTTYGKGRGRSPFVTRASFAQFLRARVEDSRNIVDLPAVGQSILQQNK